MLNTHHQKQAALSYSWTARLRHLETALAESPDSMQAWHWRAQIKVLRFVISRYGDETELPTLRTKNEPLPDFELPKPPKPPMPLAKMQQILGHVQEINRLKPNEPLPSNTLPDGTPAPLIATSRAKPKTATVKTATTSGNTSLERFLLMEIRIPDFRHGVSEQTPRWLRIVGFLMRHGLPYLPLLVIFIFIIVWLFS
jgi:hypothetical protein